MKCGPRPSRAMVEAGASTQLRRKKELPMAKRVRSSSLRLTNDLAGLGDGMREEVQAAADGDDAGADFPRQGAQGGVLGWAGEHQGCAVTAAPG